MTTITKAVYRLMDGDPPRNLYQRPGSPGYRDRLHAGMTWRVPTHGGNRACTVTIADTQMIDALAKRFGLPRNTGPYGERYKWRTPTDDALPPGYPGFYRLPDAAPRFGKRWLRADQGNFHPDLNPFFDYGDDPWVLVLDAPKWLLDSIRGVGGRVPRGYSRAVAVLAEALGK